MSDPVPTDERPGVGRPTKYRPDMADQAEKLCKLGATDAELAEFFEVHEDTVNEWKRVHPEFSESIKRGKTLADAEVADRLYQRALGYSHAAEKVFCSEGVVTRADTIAHYPPDTTAAIFWLKNRQSAKWRDKATTEHAGEVKVVIAYDEGDPPFASAPSPGPDASPGVDRPV